MLADLKKVCLQRTEDNKTDEINENHTNGTPYLMPSNAPHNNRYSGNIRENLDSTMERRSAHNIQNERDIDKHAEAELMNLLCPTVVSGRFPVESLDGSSGLVVDSIVDQILLTWFWELHSMLNENRATPSGEAFVNGQGYNLNELMASCCSFG